MHLWDGIQAMGQKDVAWVAWPGLPVKLRTMLPKNVHALNPRSLQHTFKLSFTFNSLLQLVCIDYMHLETSCGGSSGG